MVEFENLSIGQNNNIWSFGNGQGSGELDASHEYSATGVYNVQLLIANDKGCTDVHSQSIEVATGLTLYVPNSFTPNGDGLNDAWKPEILGDHLISSYDCAVYNRTGHKVFHSTIPGEAWDGTWDPALGGSGDYFVGGADTFVWQIRIKKRDGRGAEEYEGHIQMVR